MRVPIRIVGIDPGLRYTGWGVIESNGQSLHFLGSGTITSKSDDALSARLCQLYHGLTAIIEKWQPHEAAIEHVFVNKDGAATLKLGQARAIAMLVPALADIVVAEYAPNTVKKAVIGVGHGNKQQIHMMVKVLMPLAKFDSNDAADALAIAICHAHSRRCIVPTNRIILSA